jgi:Domain of unknown function (DUF4402)
MERKAPRLPWAGSQRQAWAALLCAGALVAPGPVAAAPAALTITQDAALRFGAFVVITSGSRTVSANGAVTNTSVFPVGAAPVGPAQFTVTYDRGNNNVKPIEVIFEVILPGVSPVSQAGVTGTLSAFTSDLAGAAVMVPGRAYQYTIANCVTRTCSKTFRVGARLDVNRASGGAVLTIPVPMVANLISAERL